MDQPASHNVSVYRATQDTDHRLLLRLRDYHPLRPTFPDRSASNTATSASPTTPCAVTHGLGSSAFARHYSQNPLFSSPYLDVSVRAVPLPLLRRMTGLEPRRVSPFGYLRLLRPYTPHRSFSQYNTSFLSTSCLGIHCVPLLAFRTIVRSLRLSWHALFRYYLRVDYSPVKTHQATRADGLPLLATTLQPGSCYVKSEILHAWKFIQASPSKNLPARTPNRTRAQRKGPCRDASWRRPFRQNTTKASRIAFRRTNLTLPRPVQPLHTRG